ERLQAEGFEVEHLPVGADGCVSVDRAAALLRDDTALVSLMLANNDLGTLQPVAEVAALAHEKGALVHSDGVQALGKVPLNVADLGVDLLSLSAHKIYGPKGVGALYCRRGLRLEGLQYGGEQERGVRPGTENVLGIIGFGCAATLAIVDLDQEAARLDALRCRLEAALLAGVAGAWINGAQAKRLPNTINISLPQLKGEAAAINLDMRDVAVSTGAACSSADGQPSHVLLAMGQSPDDARHSLRLSLGRETSVEIVDRVVATILELVARLG
ncbi:MAG: cysteine desulfurase, partial [Deltaproteobacteria bacterium]|nr:cysteine desulfurase [Deltaproteobacteria bacterium]